MLSLRMRKLRQCVIKWFWLEMINECYHNFILNLFFCSKLDVYYLLLLSSLCTCLSCLGYLLTLVLSWDFEVHFYLHPHTLALNCHQCLELSLVLVFSSPGCLYELTSLVVVAVLERWSILFHFYDLTVSLAACLVLKSLLSLSFVSIW